MKANDYISSGPRIKLNYHCNPSGTGFNFYHLFNDIFFLKSCSFEVFPQNKENVFQFQSQFRIKRFCFSLPKTNLIFLKSLRKFKNNFHGALVCLHRTSKAGCRSWCHFHMSSWPGCFDLHLSLRGISEEFFHGHSFSGHPCSVASTSPRCVRGERLILHIP